MIRLIDFMRLQQVGLRVTVTAERLRTSCDDFESIGNLVVKHGGAAGFKVEEAERDAEGRLISFVAVRLEDADQLEQLQNAKPPRRDDGVSSAGGGAAA